MKSSIFSILLACILVSAQTNASSSDPHQNIQEKSLLHYAYNIYSQRGEDGILQEILARLNIKHGFFVEFGAADGKWLSNAKLLVDQRWSGVFIEADSQKYRKLLKNYLKKFKTITCLNYFVTYSEDDSRGKTIDAIMNNYFPNHEIDFMSVDIDGADYLILESLKCKPKILCVEGGFSWNPHFTARVPDDIAFQNLQQPLAVMFEIGRKNGYEPICFTQNVFFIRKDLFAPFEGIANDPVTLWKDAWYMFPLHDQKFLQYLRATNPLIRMTEGPEFLDLDL